MRVVFLGTPSFAVPSLSALAAAGHELVAAVAQPDRPAGRGQALREPATKAWARERGVPVLQPEKVRDGRLAAELGALRPDVLCVAAYGRLLGRDLLGLAPFGAVNVHGSLLPKYRGAAPIQWAIARGEAETGVSIMQMDEGLDTGDVLLQRALPISPSDTAETLAPRLAEEGGKALVAALALLEKGGIVPVRQDPAAATLAPILAKEDGRIDWSRAAEEISSRLRGFSPWPGAWTTFEGKVVKILEASAVPVMTAGEERPARDAEWVPGAASAVGDRGLLVWCAPGTTLLVRRLQLEGKAPQAARDFMNGLRRKTAFLGA